MPIGHDVLLRYGNQPKELHAIPLDQPGPNLKLSRSVLFRFAFRPCGGKLSDHLTNRIIPKGRKKLAAMPSLASFDLKPMAMSRSEKFLRLKCLLLCPIPLTRSQRRASRKNFSDKGKRIDLASSLAPEAPPGKCGGDPA